MSDPVVTSVDAFELPEWLGVEEVTWTAVTSLEEAPRVSGALAGPSGATLECDLLAGDLAYPRAVLEEKWRAAAHHAWQLGETQLLEYDGRLTLVVPGTTVAVELALEAVRRLAKAVGAPSSRFTVAIRL
jgi:hypothetical protein